MIEIIFVLAATVLVFAFFVMVFYIKGRANGKDVQITACSRCDCHRKQETHERFLRYQKHTDEGIRR
jgi:hypothetical protein